jgi:hypothetical protein
MADFFITGDTLPKQVFNDVDTAPTIANLKAALTTFQAGTYTAARLATMTYNDLIYACRVNSLTVAGL